MHRSRVRFLTRLAMRVSVVACASMAAYVAFLAIAGLDPPGGSGRANGAGGVGELLSDRDVQQPTPAADLIEAARVALAHCLVRQGVRFFLADTRLLSFMADARNDGGDAAMASISLERLYLGRHIALDVGVFEDDLGPSPARKLEAVVDGCVPETGAAVSVRGLSFTSGEHAPYVFNVKGAPVTVDGRDAEKIHPLAIRIRIAPPRGDTVDITIRVFHTRRNFAWFSSTRVAGSGRRGLRVSPGAMGRLSVPLFVLIPGVLPAPPAAKALGAGTWSVPDDPAAFVSATRNGALTECDFEQAVRHDRQYGSGAAGVDAEGAVRARGQAALFTSIAADLLAITADALSAANVTFWINSGTLLGWRRECGVIPHTRDVDIGVFISEYSEAMVHELTSRGLQLKHSLGLPEWGFELSFTFRGTKLDIFFFYIETDHAWNGGTQVKSGKRYKYTFPLFTLCRAEVASVLVRVPCNSTAHVIANYGINWQVPVKTWDWKSSPNNVREAGIWPEDVRKRAIIIYKKGQ
eukprot:Opistho-2@74111